MDNLLGPDSNIFEKCHLLQPGLRFVSGKATAKWRQKKKTLNHAPGGEINEGRSEVHLNPPSCFRGGYGSAKQNERLARSLHCQCCSVRKATQCHLKPTGTAPARGKAAVALLGERCLQTAHGSCNARLWQHTRLEGRFGRASREDRRTSSQTQRNITEPHLFTPGGGFAPFCLPSSCGSLRGERTAAN